MGGALHDHRLGACETAIGPWSTVTREDVSQTSLLAFGPNPQRCTSAHASLQSVQTPQLKPIRGVDEAIPKHSRSDAPESHPPAGTGRQ